MRSSNNHPSILRPLIPIIVLGVVFSLSLFVSAGTMNWHFAWVYLGLVMTSQGIMAIFFVRKNPDLAGERTQLIGRRDIDRVLAGIMALYGPISICVVSGLNQRYGWQSSIPFGFQLATLGVAVAGTLLTMWAMATNRFFYGVMRIEKGHTVCNDGPYQIVRHPGYLGTLLFTAATPLMLGSMWAFIPAGVTMYVIAVRTTLEDKKLRNELDGYRSYAQRVCYRLLPGVW